MVKSASQRQVADADQEECKDRFVYRACVRAYERKDVEKTEILCGGGEVVVEEAEGGEISTHSGCFQTLACNDVRLKNNCGAVAWSRLPHMSECFCRTDENPSLAVDYRDTMKLQPEMNMMKSVFAGEIEQHQTHQSVDSSWRP